MHYNMWPVWMEDSIGNYCTLGTTDLAIDHVHAGTLIALTLSLPSGPGFRIVLQ